MNYIIIHCLKKKKAVKGTIIILYSTIACSDTKQGHSLSESRRSKGHRLPCEFSFSVSHVSGHIKCRSSAGWAESGEDGKLESNKKVGGGRTKRVSISPTQWLHLHCGSCRSDPPETWIVSCGYSLPGHCPWVPVRHLSPSFISRFPKLSLSCWNI